MQDTSLAVQTASEQIAHFAHLLSDFQQRMPASKADDFLGIDHGSIERAYRRGEIRPYIMPDHPNRRLYTPSILGEWLEKYCRPPAINVPG